MTTWEEIRDEVAEMLADGEPLEDIISELEKMKNEMAKENLLKAMDDMKKREQTNEDYIQTCNHKELTEILFRMIVNGTVIRPDRRYISEWLKAPHKES